MKMWTRVGTEWPRFAHGQTGEAPVPTWSVVIDRGGNYEL